MRTSAVVFAALAAMVEEQAGSAIQHSRGASGDYSSQPAREGTHKNHEPFRLMNVWKKAKVQGKRFGGQAGHKMHEVGAKMDVWMHKHRG